MAISPNFSVSQAALTPSQVTVTDTSTGTYDTITQRRVYISDAYGNYLTGGGTANTYTEWPLAEQSITVDILENDTAANILVEWLNASNVVVNSLNANYGLSQFGKQFFFYLVQLQGLTPGIYQDSNYSGNMALFWANLIGGDNAILYGNDLQGAQESYNREIQMQQQQNYFF